MKLSKIDLKKILKSIKTIEDETLTETQTLAIKELKSILQPDGIPQTTLSATTLSKDPNLSLSREIIEKTTGINCSKLNSKNSRGKLLSPLVLPNDIKPIDPNTWLEQGLNQLQNSLWPRLESSHRLTIDLIILFALNNSIYSKTFDFRLGESREYVGNIVNQKLGRVTLNSMNDYDIGYSDDQEHRTLLIEAKQKGFSENDEIELLVQMSIIFATRVEEEKAPVVYGALATKDTWRFYRIDKEGYVQKAIDIQFVDDGLSKVLGILDYILREIARQTPTIAKFPTVENLPIADLSIQDSDISSKGEEPTITVVQNLTK